MKEVASWLHLPPTSNPKTTNLQRRLRRSSGYVPQGCPGEGPPPLPWHPFSRQW